jgi:hypothetical protein
LRRAGVEFSAFISRPSIPSKTLATRSWRSGPLPGSRRDPIGLGKARHPKWLVNRPTQGLAPKAAAAPWA